MTHHARMLGVFVTLLIALSISPLPAHAGCSLGTPPAASSVSCEDPIETSLNALAGGDFSGNLYSAGLNSSLYDAARKQYASFTFPNRVRPSFIAEVRAESDVQAVVLYANQCGYSVSVRSGGHSYIGMSSCDSEETPCVQINMRLMNDAAVTGSMVTVGPGIILEEFADVLHENGLYVPTGECAKIGIGGHVQTGGFGMWSRHFGPAAHHVDSYRVVLANGMIQSVTKPTGSTSELNDDLFFAVLGGASGSFGVVTQLTFRAIADADYFSVWWKADILWNVEGVVSMWRKWMELANLPQYKDDLRWSIHSSGVGIAPTGMPNYFEFQASWVSPLADAGDYDPTFFQSILDACTGCVVIPPGVVNVSEPLSKSLKDRSLVAKDYDGSFFPYPFQHFAKGSRQTSFLPSPDQAEAVVRAVDALMPNENSTHMYITQHSTGCSHGPKANGDTIALPYPDQAFCVNSDIYYPSPLLQPAIEPLNANVLAAVDVTLANTHEMFWQASTGSVKDLSKAEDAARYYESESKVRRLGAIKHCVDPDNRFRNVFSLPPTADTDECDLGTHSCATEADCANTLGSFTCACRSGFNGDGTTCVEEEETFMLTASTTLEGMALADFTEDAENVFKAQVAALLAGKTAADVTVTGTSATTRRRMLAVGVQVDYQVGGFASLSEVQTAAETVEAKKDELMTALKEDASFASLTGLSNAFEDVDVPPDRIDGAAARPTTSLWLSAAVLAAAARVVAR